jgi:predicted RNA methylase
MKQPKDIQLVEERRQLKQNEVDSSKSKLDRNKLGQFSTPRKLADELLLYAKTLKQFKQVNFFDPAFGMGSFYTALIKAFGRNADALGFEIDKDYFAAAREVWRDYDALKIKNVDFTFEQPSDYQKANLLICNPPYIRHQHMDAKTKNRLKTAAFEATGESLSGLAGLHAYFMLLSHKWLEENGIAIWLVPSEILEVNYGKSIRDYLLNTVSLDRIHFFDHTDGKFEDALVSSCVIVYRKGLPLADPGVKVTSRRQPWYSQEKREAPKYFVRYMNRETKSDNSHHTIFIKNESDAIAANSYLMLYEKPTELFSTAPTEKDLWSFLSKGLDKTLYRYGRTYGGGLVKFEPNELRNIPLYT